MTAEFLFPSRGSFLEDRKGDPSRVIKLFREARPPEKVDYDLTPHETRLLKLLVEGHN